MDTKTPAARLQAAHAAREANIHILALEARLDRSGRDEREVGLFCECGCLEALPLTVSEYEAAGGAWLEGPRASATEGRRRRAEPDRRPRARAARARRPRAAVARATARRRRRARTARRQALPRSSRAGTSRASRAPVARCRPRCSRREF